MQAASARNGDNATNLSAGEVRLGIVPVIITRGADAAKPPRLAAALPLHVRPGYL
jgi:hypothetical protein